MKVFPEELADRTSHGFKRTSTNSFRTSFFKERTSQPFCRTSLFAHQKTRSL